MPAQASVGVFNGTLTENVGDNTNIGLGDNTNIGVGNNTNIGP